jgi:hypothetical protein
MCVARHQRLTPIIPATQEAEIRRTTVQRQLGQILLETLSEKQTKEKRTGGVAQEVACLPSKREALNSNSSIVKKKNK